jgi:hypothetical protein
VDIPGRFEFASIPVIVHLVSSEFHAVDCDFDIALKAHYERRNRRLEGFSSFSSCFERTAVVNNDTESSARAKHGEGLPRSLWENRETRDERDAHCEEFHGAAFLSTIALYAFRRLRCGVSGEQLTEKQLESWQQGRSQRMYDWGRQGWPVPSFSVQIDRIDDPSFFDSAFEVALESRMELGDSVARSQDFDRDMWHQRVLASHDKKYAKVRGVPWDTRATRLTLAGHHFAALSMADKTPQCCTQPAQCAIAFSPITSHV